MPTEIGKAYVQIIPTATGIKEKLKEELGGAGEESGKHTGLKIGSAIKNAIVAAGIGTAIKAAVSEGAKLEQSFGGLETIYGAASEAAKKYAAEAATAGISANDYAEQAVSFGASLKMAFGGDVTRAAEAANIAILDMADNAAKMGTPIESIQNAYQGFAKQNYTMLDNLKLGYGGTKSEMERLLKDAQKLSGVEYNIDNLGDVYDAIHVIQGELGLTGVAADEAKNTFSGSLGAMKAAAQNVLGNLALGEDVKPALNTLLENVETFVVNNAIPALVNVVSSLPSVLMAALPRLSAGLKDLVLNLKDQLIKNLPGMIPDLVNGIADTVAAVTSDLSVIVDAGIQMLVALGEGLIEALPDLIRRVPEIVSNIANVINDNAPKMIDGALHLIVELGRGLIQNIPVLIENIPKIFKAVFDAWQAVNWINLGKTVLTAIKNGLSSIGTMLRNLSKDGIKGIVDTFRNGVSSVKNAVMRVCDGIHDVFLNLPSKLREIGGNLVRGLWNGISDKVSWVLDKIRGFGGLVLSGIKSIFGIHSPSKEMEWMGQMLDQGLVRGITGGMGGVKAAMGDLHDTAMFGFNPTLSAGGGVTNSIDGINITVYGAPGQSEEQLAEKIMDIMQTRLDQRGAALA